MLDEGGEPKDCYQMIITGIKEQVQVLGFIS